MKSILLASAVFLLLILPEHLSSQTSQDSSSITTSSKKIKKSSIFSGRPGKSMLMSLVIPGAGQIYNKSYLRVPFVWGAVGGMGLLVRYNTRQYQCYRDVYIHLIDGTPVDLPAHCQYDNNGDGIWDLEQITDASRVRLIRDQANKNKQASIVGFALLWLLNGVDAFVDAHLKDFDTKDDLSIEIGTRFDNDPNSPIRMGLYVQF